ncbi:protransforming growth factor alpha-like isoform X2 [Ambystoma mexicanum]|uniref:protransforming growth factor alpha-like isoform X2 n=1 Tax=Ambystoma mexicanum TaxID=8296 RepID=UPI0037E7FAEA
MLQLHNRTNMLPVKTCLASMPFYRRGNVYSVANTLYPATTTHCSALRQGKVKTMFGVFVLLAAEQASNSTFEQMFSSCPDLYKHFCFSGTCRYLLSEETPACICFKGYVGSRCESMDLLQILSESPHSIMAVAFAVTILVALSLIISVGLSVYFCKQKRTMSQLTLLDNTDV